MFRSPRHLPSLSTMLDDLPANRVQIARHLGITTRTLARYIAADQAPYAIMLALFWETRWGRSAADCEAATFGTLHKQLSDARERQIDALRRQIALLEGELARNGDKAANGPVWLIG